MNSTTADTAFYMPDFLLCLGGAAVLAFLLMVTLPKAMYKGDDPLPSLPKFFLWLAPLISLPIAAVLYLINNASSLIIVVWAIIAGVGAVATLTDFKLHRVPNVLMANQFTLVTVALIAQAVMADDWSNLMWAGIALVGTAAYFFMQFLFGIHAAGDLKYMPTVAMALGFINIWLALMWLVVGYLFTMVFGVVELATAKKERGPKKDLKGAMVPPFYISIIVLPLAISAGMVAGI